jgi:hypothetical protein
LVDGLLLSHPWVMTIQCKQSGDQELLHQYLQIILRTEMHFAIPHKSYSHHILTVATYTIMNISPFSRNVFLPNISIKENHFLRNGENSYYFLVSDHSIIKDAP